MQKSVRSIALSICVLSAFAVPSLQAERAGTNPHPQVQPAPTLLQLITYTVWSYFGL